MKRLVGNAALRSGSVTRTITPLSSLESCVTSALRYHSTPSQVTPKNPAQGIIQTFEEAGSTGDCSWFPPNLIFCENRGSLSSVYFLTSNTHHRPELLPSPGERGLWGAPDRAASTQRGGTELGAGRCTAAANVTPQSLYGLLLDLSSGHVWEGTCWLHVNIHPKTIIRILMFPQLQSNVDFFFFFMV